MIKYGLHAARIVAAAFAILVFQFGAGNTGTVFAQAPRRVIIDTDPGTDDALAILLALNSPEIRVEALTIVAGNVTAAVGLENGLKITSLAGRCDLPVAKGAQGPLHGKLITEPFWNGPNGLGGAELPASRCKALLTMTTRVRCTTTY